MRKLLIILVMLLTACAAVPKFPDLPPGATKACLPLQSLDPKEATLSKLMKTISTNYGLYYDCAAQVDALLEWHKAQSEIIKQIK